ncbi:MAG: hypothetical protein LBT62_07850 [Deltaproteobacteria bacterium]|jgi:dihydroorotate dehydrogenase electron transfer subunit|nr:hypothetical protein [Deltaproteobacteria bacterium]
MTGANIVNASVVGVRNLGGNTCLLTLEADDGNWKALGRFVRLRAWGEPGKGRQTPIGALLDRPFSIHRIVGRNIEFLIRAVGTATTILSSLKPDDVVKMTGPLGRGLDEIVADYADDDWYLAAGGVGLGPMGSISDSLKNKATLLYGEKSASAQLDYNWLKGWASDVKAATQDGSGYGEQGLVTDLLARELENQLRPIFACGPEGMLKAVVKLAKRHNAPLWLSMEARMACGLGVCLSCSAPLADNDRLRLCVDGPVVEARKLDWWTNQ